VEESVADVVLSRGNVQARLDGGSSRDNEARWGCCVVESATGPRCPNAEGSKSGSGVGEGDDGPVCAAG